MTLSLAAAGCQDFARFVATDSIRIHRGCRRSGLGRHQNLAARGGRALEAVGQIGSARAGVAVGADAGGDVERSFDPGYLSWMQAEGYAYTPRGLPEAACSVEDGDDIRKTSAMGFELSHGASDIYPSGSAP